MEVMYIKYEKGRRHCIIKEGENVLMKNEKVIPFKPKSNINKKKTKYISESESNSYKVIPLLNANDKVNNEITTFFFNAVHKNHLKNR